MTSGIDAADNAAALTAAIAEAAVGGAVMLFTPEMCGCLDRDRTRAALSIRAPDDDPVLAAVRGAAARHRIWVAAGSLAVRGNGDDGRWCNRSFIVDDRGAVRATYDKMHLFDIDLPDGTSWQESAAYAAGDQPVVADTPIGRIGLAVCYDLRFPALFAALSDAGAVILSVPAAFTVPTGLRHWHVLLRARAIENACFVIAAAQVGHHADGRTTYGHSLVIDPSGEIVLDMGGEAPGIAFADLDMEKMAAVRQSIPVLAHRRSIGPVMKS